MANDADDRDDLEERIERLEATLEELDAAVQDDERIDAGRREPGTATEAALRLTERLAVPAAVAALEANVRLLEYLQDRLRALEEREPSEAPATATAVGERALDRLDEALARLEDAVADADLPRDAEARQLLRRARDLNDEVRARVGEHPGAVTGPDVVEIDVEEELDEVREEVEDEDPGEDEA